MNAKGMMSVVAVAILLCASTAFGDEVDVGLPEATDELKASARQLISSGIKSDDSIKMTRLMMENRFRHEHIIRAHEILMEARQADLPVEPIMNKAYEGMAKQVQEGRVLQAMEQVRSRHTFAYQQARQIAKNEDQVTHLGDLIAGSLAAGMKDQDVGRIMEMLQNRSRHMTRSDVEELAVQTFMTTRTMARLDVSSSTTSDVLCQALQNAYRAREMETLRNRFMAQSRNSKPESVAKGYSHAMQQGRGGGSSGGSGEGGQGGHGGMGGSGGPGGSGGGSGGPGGSGGGPGGGGPAGPGGGNK